MDWFRAAVVAVSLVLAGAGCGGASNGASTSAGATPAATSGASLSASVPTVTPRPSRVTPSATAKPSAKPTPHGTTYVIKTGDTLYAIAVRFKVTVAQILAANPSITNPNQITIGQRIVIPIP